MRERVSLVPCSEECHAGRCYSMSDPLPHLTIKRRVCSLVPHDGYQSRQHVFGNG